MLTLVHAADLHLETTFPDVRGGNRRRAALAEALVRIVDLALERNADVLTFGGDLFESERAGPQTARFLFEQFARFRKPVFVAPGNHDAYSSRAAYARDDLPPNVRVFAQAAWRAFPLGDGITLYGFGHTPVEPGRPFGTARFDRDGVRIALVHGSDEDRCPPGKRATAPFRIEEIVRSGATVALSGHYHGGYVAGEGGRPILAYPGSPEPIRFGERGAHGALVVEVHDERVHVEPVPLARTRLVDIDVRLDRASSEHAVIAALDAALSEYRGGDYVRARLQGAVDRGTRVDCDLLAERCGAHVGALEVIDKTLFADYDALGSRQNVLGHVVADLRERARGGDGDAERALRYVVAAFVGADIAP
ncbi:MAG: exonuclease SbcCD subunit D [Candidatus Velthaea sp.]